MTLSLHHVSGPLGAWVATPGYMAAEIRAVQGIIDEIMRGLQPAYDRACPSKPTGERWPDGQPVMGIPKECTPQSPGFLPIAKTWREFGAFLNEWYTFVANHDEWTELLWGATYDSIMDFKKRAISWKAIVSALPDVDLIAPTSEVPGGFPWKKVALVAFAIGGLYAAAKIVPPLLRKP